MSLSIPFLLLPLTFTANAALSAHTANTIQGTKPYLLLSDGVTKLTSTAELLGFSMWDGTYEANGTTKHMVQITSAQSGALTAPVGMKYSDVITLVTANNATNAVSGATVGDSDGDAAIAANTSVSGTMKATWKDGGVVITDLTKKLSVCGGPYTLEISTTNVKANTTYGDPNINSYTDSTKTYTFTANGQGICYLKPASMEVNTGGYNSAVFDTTKGFTVASGFPKTGFYKAVFSLIGSGTDQSKFRCNKTSSDITLSTASGVGTNCTVTYNTVTKPTSPITINMEYYDGSTWSPLESFTIPIPTKWATVKGQAQYKTDGNPKTNGTFPAANLCAGSDLGTITPAKAGSYFFARNELVNSSIANQPAANRAQGGYFSRDTGITGGVDNSTFGSEWGNLYYGYSGSGFEASNFVWTSDAHSTTYQFVVRSLDGRVYVDHPTYTYLTVCR